MRLTANKLAPAVEDGGARAVERDDQRAHGAGAGRAPARMADGADDQPVDLARQRVEPADFPRRACLGEDVEQPVEHAVDRMLPPADEYLPQPGETGRKSADREQAEPEPIAPAIHEAQLLAIE